MRWVEFSWSWDQRNESLAVDPLRVCTQGPPVPSPLPAKVTAKWARSYSYILAMEQQWLSPSMSSPESGISPGISQCIVMKTAL